MIAVFFGVAMALVKGTGGGLRYDLGNLSAPWLIIPAMIGIQFHRRTLPAVVLGGMAALLSLLGFYATTAAVWNLVNTHTARNNLQVLVAGMITAAVVAAIAAQLPVVDHLAAIISGILLIGEPIVELVTVHHLGFSTDPASMTIEATIGALIVLGALATRSSGSKTN